MGLQQRQAKNPYTPFIISFVCLVLWAAGTFAYITWAISQSQHKWCTTIELLNDAPAPQPSPGNPSRIYDAKLAQDFRALQQELGC